VTAAHDSASSLRRPFTTVQQNGDQERSPQHLVGDTASLFSRLCFSGISGRVFRVALPCLWYAGSRSVAWRGGGTSACATSLPAHRLRGVWQRTVRRFPIRLQRAPFFAVSSSLFNTVRILLCWRRVALRGFYNFVQVHKQRIAF